MTRRLSASHARPAGRVRPEEAIATGMEFHRPSPADTSTSEPDERYTLPSGQAAAPKNSAGRVGLIGTSSSFRGPSVCSRRSPALDRLEEGVRRGRRDQDAAVRRHADGTHVPDPGLERREGLRRRANEGKGREG